MTHFLEISDSETNTFWGFKGHDVQPHCWDSLTDKSIENKTVSCRKQKGRRGVCIAGARRGQIVLALPTVVDVLGEFHTCW